MARNLAGNKFADRLQKWWTNRDRSDRPLPTLLWLAKDRNRLNNWLDAIALSGLGMASLLVLRGTANVPIMFALWICQCSLMSVGRPFYGYGWETQLAELTFHSIFLVPFISLTRIPVRTPTPAIVVWSIKWHLFRIMMGAGLIKLRSGDPKWRNLTAMDYFYETQPVPNLLTKALHRLPKTWHKFEVLSNHLVELVAPWLLIFPFLPRKWRMTGAIIQIVFQIILITSGNLSFLNWLTIVPSFICLDDMFYAKYFSQNDVQIVSKALVTSRTMMKLSLGFLSRSIVSLAFGVLVAKLSIPVVKNLLSKNQVMNASFDPLRLINTYGAFGTVSEERIELVIESAHSYAGPWKEYTFNVKPGNPFRGAKWITPYHHRLDWQLWITQFSRDPPLWMYTLLLKLLRQEPDVIGLLDPKTGDPWGKHSCVHNPLKDDESSKPKYIRVERYKYKFNYSKETNEDDLIPYWYRERIGRFYPRQGVVSESDLFEIVSRTT
mmetsp:Transcript_10737/g.14007  ORF Transcript_10737/g.14007 Transcript_10737/m.14007 type:complete len:493 (+) Transcript_10737:624-2102(+)